MKNQLPVYLFHQGTNYCSYEFLGAHFGIFQGKKGVFFRVFAKNAQSVSVVGDFNGWDYSLNPMQRIPQSGIWELFIEGIKEKVCYKYAIQTEGKIIYKADPFAFYSQVAPNTASLTYEIEGYNWADGEYIAERKSKNFKKLPLNIYEVNLASWKKKENGEYLTYKELAVDLVKYLKKMNYTHVEFMPLTEYPHDPSWGYQVTGFYSITSRFGTPKDFMYLVEQCHLNGIGVILDWVPAHFPKDEHGLALFDGTALFEPDDELLKERKTWGTLAFDYAKTEVQSFLVSSAVFLIEKFHLDGIRVDAVSSMIYLDFDKKEGEWRANDEGGNLNKSAIAFLQKLNAVIHDRCEGVLTIAEESSAFPMVTGDIKEGGLGFDYKWNMGWSNDVLSYMTYDPYFRSQCHNKMNFSMMYAFSENYVLPISHDEVVYGKKSLAGKMPGSIEDKYAQVRALMGYTYSHPGKKLSFMGNELGQLEEWNFEKKLDFNSLEDEKVKRLNHFFKKINEFYLANPALYEIEDSWLGFNWLVADDSNSNLFAYERMSENGQKILVVINFSGVDLQDYRIGAEKGKYKLIFDSDAKSFGGCGKVVKKVYTAKLAPANGKKHSLTVSVPKFSFLYLEKFE